MSDDLSDTLREIVARLDAHGVPYMLVGSVAALAHGRARSTQAFDVVIEAAPKRLRAFVRDLPSDRFYASDEAALEAVHLETQFNVIDLTTGWKVDLIPRKSREFSETEFARRRIVDVVDTSVWVATVEDTIVAKLEWSERSGGSERQLEDVRALIQLAGERLDRAHVEHWVAQLGLTAAWHTVAGA